MSLVIQTIEHSGKFIPVVVIVEELVGTNSTRTYFYKRGTGEIVRELIPENFVVSRHAWRYDSEGVAKEEGQELLSFAKNQLVRA